MSDRTFGESVGYVLGTRQDLIGLFCPACAHSRMVAATPEADLITYVETVKQTGPGTRCCACQRFPLAVQAQELLRPGALLHFMGAVLKMAEREQKRRELAEQHPRSTR